MARVEALKEMLKDLNELKSDILEGFESKNEIEKELLKEIYKQKVAEESEIRKQIGREEEEDSRTKIARKEDEEKQDCA